MEKKNLITLQTQKVMTLLKSQGQTLSLAESCTGGLLASEMTKLSGVSEVFLGGVVCYHGNVKRDLLEVPEETLKKFGEVSPQVASLLAQGACRVMRSDWAVGITGIAGPTGGTPDKPVGTVCFSVVGPNLEETVTQHFNPQWEREKIQQASAEFALDLLIKNFNS